MGSLLFDLATLPASGPPAAVEVAFSDLRVRHRLELDAAEMNLRELRILPGIGETRALAILTARAARRRAGLDPTFDWSTVHGIGPRTLERVEGWFCERGVQPAVSGNRSPCTVSSSP